MITVYLHLLFQIVSQSKIFTTAIFSILLMKRRLSSIQWLSLAVLTTGVCLVQMQTTTPKKLPGYEQNPFVGKGFSRLLIVFRIVTWLL